MIWQQIQNEVRKINNKIGEVFKPHNKIVAENADKSTPSTQPIKHKPDGK